MRAERIANIVILGYLAPNIEDFLPMIRRLKGEVVIVDFYRTNYDREIFLRQLKRKIASYERDVRIRLFGFSLGANLALAVATACGMKLSRRMELYLICPVLAECCLNDVAFLQVEGLSRIGGTISRFFGRALTEKRLEIYDRGVTVGEIISGAEAIAKADCRGTLYRGRFTMSIYLILAENDEYLNNDIVREIVGTMCLGREKVVVVDAVQNCWSLKDIFRQVRSTRKTLRPIVDAMAFTPAFTG